MVWRFARKLLWYDMCQIYGGSIYDAVEDEPELRQQWLNQWFIAGTPMTARAHAAQYGLQLLPQKVGWVQDDREIKW